MARNYTIEVRLTKEEYERIKKKCEVLGLTVSAFIRLVTLKSKVEVTE